MHALHLLIHHILLACFDVLLQWKPSQCVCLLPTDVSAIHKPIASKQCPLAQCVMQAKGSLIGGKGVHKHTNVLAVARHS